MYVYIFRQSWHKEQFFLFNCGGEISKVRPQKGHCLDQNQSQLLIVNYGYNNNTDLTEYLT